MNSPKTEPIQQEFQFSGCNHRLARPIDPDPVPGKRDTSRQAAESVRKSAPQQRQAVLSLIRSKRSYGCTRDEISVLMQISPQSATPRVLELIKAGNVVETNRKRTTRSGRNARVLVAKEFAGGNDGR